MTKQLPAFRIKDGFSCKLDIPGYKTKQHGSAWIAHNGESTITVTLMERQDFRVAWGVMYTEIDGDIYCKTGVTDCCNGFDLAAAAINDVLADMTKYWVYPLVAA